MTTNGQKIAYIRVSTEDQNLARQREALSPYGIDRWFEEKISGKDTSRPQLQEMLSYVREGDTIYVHDFSRLARSTVDLLSIIDTLKAKGVTLVSNKESFDTSTPTGKMMTTIIGALNEFERANMLERQGEGIVIAKREGKYGGRRPVAIADLETNPHYIEWKDHKISKSELARRLHISRNTLNKIMSASEVSE